MTEPKTGASSRRPRRSQRVSLPRGAKKRRPNDESSITNTTPASNELEMLLRPQRIGPIPKDPTDWPWERILLEGGPLDQPELIRLMARGVDWWRQSRHPKSSIPEAWPDFVTWVCQHIPVIERMAILPDLIDRWKERETWRLRELEGQRQQAMRQAYAYFQLHVPLSAGAFIQSFPDAKTIECNQYAYEFGGTLNGPFSFYFCGQCEWAEKRFFFIRKWPLWDPNIYPHFQWNEPMIVSFPRHSGERLLLLQEFFSTIFNKDVLSILGGYLYCFSKPRVFLSDQIDFPDHLYLEGMSKNNVISITPKIRDDICEQHLKLVHHREMAWSKTS